MTKANQKQIEAMVQNRKYISYGERLLRKGLSILTLVAVIIASFLMMGRGGEEVTVTYVERGNLELRVFLQENEFFDVPYLTHDMQIIATLIDYLDVTFNYVFDASDYLDYTVNYSLEAQTIVFRPNNPNNIINRWSSTLFESNDKHLDNQRSITINENIQLIYREYNDLVRAFKTTYNLSADSHLILTFTVNIEGVHEQTEEVITHTNQLSLTVPLTEQMVDITINYNDINNTGSFSGITNPDFRDYLFGAIIILASIILLINLFKLISLINISKNKKSTYEKILKNILIEYDRLIIEAKRVIDIPEEVNLVEVKEFSELVDVSDKLGQPILFMEIHRNQKCWFIVRNKEDFYRFILKGADLEE